MTVEDFVHTYLSRCMRNAASHDYTTVIAGVLDREL